MESVVYIVRTESVVYIATMYVRKVSCTLPLCIYGKCRVHCHYVRTESFLYIATMYVRKVSCILSLCTYGMCRVYCHYVRTESVVYIATMYVRNVSCILSLHTPKTTTRCNLLKQKASSHSCIRLFSFYHSQLGQRLTHVGNSSKKRALEI